MTLLRKMNRGAAVTIAAVLAVAAYLIVTAVAENAQKPDIQKACEDFLADYTAYSMLPEEYRSGEQAMTREAFDAYVGEMKDAMSPHFIDEPVKIRETVLENLERSLSSQYRFGADTLGIKDFEKTSVSYKYVFEDDLVTVEIISAGDYTGPSPNGDGSFVQLQITDYDTVILQKTGGWKVVSAAIGTRQSTAGREIS